MKKIFFILICFSSFSCNRTIENEKGLLEKFTNDLFIKEKGLKETLLKYSILTENDFKQDSEYLMSFCMYLNKDIIKELSETNNEFQITEVNEHLPSIKVILRNNETAYLFECGTIQTIYILNPDGKIITYVAKPSPVKAGVTTFTPIYLKELMGIENPK